MHRSLVFTIAACLTAGVALAQSDSQYLANVDDQGIILDGYDAVVLHTEGALVKGSPNLKIHYQGADYLFYRADTFNAFKANPGRYAPQFGGYCAMSMSMGMVEPGDVSTWSIIDGRLVLQRNAKAVGMWNKDPEMNLYKADQRYAQVLKEKGKATEYLVSLDDNQLMLDGHDPVALFNHKKLMKGLPQYISYYQGGCYVFTSRAHQNTFNAAPEKYVPQFGGYCAMSMAMGMVEKANVATWSYVNGRLVMQRNEKAVGMWNKDPEGSLAKADANWPKVLKKENKKE